MVFVFRVFAVRLRRILHRLGSGVSSSERANRSKCKSASNQSSNQFLQSESPIRVLSDKTNNGQNVATRDYTYEALDWLTPLYNMLFIYANPIMMNRCSVNRCSVRRTNPRCYEVDHP